MISKELKEKILAYIDIHYIEPPKFELKKEFHSIFPKASSSLKQEGCPSEFLFDYSESFNFKVESSFQEHLFYLIDSIELDDVYKKANMDKKLFSKIRSNKDYHPKKETVLALCLSMKLSLDESKDLLMKAGYALSNANLQDVIIQYCIETKEFDINKVNQILFEFEQKTLGV